MNNNDENIGGGRRLYSCSQTEPAVFYHNSISVVSLRIITLSVLYHNFGAMDRWAGKVALVTGASIGIGAQIAKMLAENGMKVIAVARRLEKLEELAASIKREFKTDIYTMTCDVRKEEDILRVFKWANDKLGGVDVVVNNAAVVASDPIIGKT